VVKKPFVVCVILPISIQSEKTDRTFLDSGTTTVQILIHPFV